jgi:nucleoside-diphosphate-sugar epimerase
MQILVFGGSGMLGSEIVNYLCKNYRVYSTYRNTKPKKIKGVFWKKINLEYPINWKIKPDIIINCVVTSKFSKKNQTENYIKSNIIAVKNLLDFAIKKKQKKL